MQSTELLVSIVTPVYNIGNFLKETVDSVLTQSYKNWELLLIDDNSSDDSADIIRMYEKKDSRIKGFYLPENKGAGNSRNVGLDNADGEYIAFLDSDDLWLPDKLEQQVNFFKNRKEVQILYSWYSIIDEKGAESVYFKAPSKLNFARLKYNNYILTSTLICTKQAVANIRFSLMRVRQDWVFFLDILKGESYAYCIPKVLVKYRKMANSLSSNRFKLIKPNFDIFKSYLYGNNSYLAALHFIVFTPFYFHNKIFNKKKFTS
jgi:teichuronic acid biosynthesis glycosyltransferase TuaG